MKKQKYSRATTKTFKSKVSKVSKKDLAKVDYKHKNLENKYYNNEEII